MVTAVRIIAVFALVFLCTETDVRAEGWRAFLSPGPVGKGHSKVASKCDRCHLVYKGIPDEKCLACHIAIQDRLDSKVGFHAQSRTSPCIECHDDHKGSSHSMTKAEALESFDHGKTVFALEGAHQPLPCEACHDRPLERVDKTCKGCHGDRHHDGTFGANCEGCHGSSSWTAGIKTLAEHKLRMDGGHQLLECLDCHTQGANLQDNVPCATCHERAHGGTEEACDGCHSVSGFKPAKFDHDLCPCAFPGKHKTASCLSCHEGFRFTDTPTLCTGCHTKDLTHDPLGECSVCHSPLSWTKNRFDHNRQSRFRLRNKHLEVDCFRCHTQKRRGRRAFKAAPTACYGCHKKDGIDAHGDFGDCAKCHATTGFDKSTFDHSATGFVLDGRHESLRCQECHEQKMEGYPKRKARPAKSKAKDRSQKQTYHPPRIQRPLKVSETLVAMLRSQTSIDAPSSTSSSKPPAGVQRHRGLRRQGGRPSAPSIPPAVALVSASTPSGGSGDERACSHCHEDVHRGSARGNCTRCHETASWRPSTFDIAQHATTRFPLRDAHQKTACRLCHVDAQMSGQPTECAGCHMDVHQGRFGSRCESCHNEVAFAPAPGFDHASTGFALIGPHTEVGCLKCHGQDGGEDLTQRKAATACKTCHAVGHGVELGNDCERCHVLKVDKKFADAPRNRFDHRKTPFALERRHRVLNCKQCHPAPVAGGANIAPTGRCVTCHLDPHKGNNSNDCSLCHEPDRWRLVRFDHDTAGWPLRGRHFVTPCAACHTNQRWFGLTTDCFDCHALDAARGLSVAPEAHPFGRLDCTDCHFSGWTWQIL